MKAVDESLLILLSYRWIVLDKTIEIGSFDNLHFRRFDAFLREKTRRAFVRTIERRDEIPFEEDPESNVLALVVENRRSNLDGSDRVFRRLFRRIVWEGTDRFRSYLRFDLSRQPFIMMQ